MEMMAEMCLPEASEWDLTSDGSDTEAQYGDVCKGDTYQLFAKVPVREQFLKQ